jgi:hypothetical protein
MNEQQFIYERLSYLNDRIMFLYDTVERQQDLLGKLFNLVEQMQSPEYASKQAKLAEMKDVADKIKFMRDYMKRG